jgi:hypothetical protein
MILSFTYTVLLQTISPCMWHDPNKYSNCLTHLPRRWLPPSSWSHPYLRDINREELTSMVTSMQITSMVTSMHIDPSWSLWLNNKSLPQHPSLAAVAGSSAIRQIDALGGTHCRRIASGRQPVRRRSPHAADKHARPAEAVATKRARLPIRSYHGSFIIC